MKRFFFALDRDNPYADFKIIETYRDYSEIGTDTDIIGYTLISITKLCD